MLPKTKLEFLDVTAKVAAQTSEVQEMLEAEPLLIMAFAVYTGVLARKFYSEEPDDITDDTEDEIRTVTWEVKFKHEVENITFVIYKKVMGDGKKDWRLRIYHETDVIGDYYFNNEGEAHLAILQYINEKM